VKILSAVLWILLAASASAQDFTQLAALYDYDKTASLTFERKELDHRAGYKAWSIRFALPKAGTMTGYLVTPDVPSRAASSCHPAIVWMHSSGAIGFLGDAVLMAKAGAVSMIVQSVDGLPSADAEDAKNQSIADIVGLRRAADILQSRADVDPARLAFVGHSYGSMMGAVAISVDSRFRAAVFEVGLLGMSIHIGTSPGAWATGVRKDLGDKLPHFLDVLSIVDDKNYIGHAPAIPKLFQSAWYDPGVPHSDAEDFFNLATGPKQLKWYDSGHDIDDPAAAIDRARFLAEHLHLPDIGRVLDNGRPRR
jgi:dienelactone hydrolase